jgi:C4-dicarboxylate-specific signal transduction histidine kinase
MDTSGKLEAAFIGRITASTTHEFRNVLAIIKESAGLIEDLVNSDSLGGPEQAERLLKVTRRIDAQVGRGAELLSHLNRFSHCIDRSQNGVGLDQEVEQVVFLSQRLAREGRYQLEAVPGTENLTVMINSLRFQMVLFTAVECCLEQVPDGGSVTVRTFRNGNQPAIEFTGEADDGSALPSPTGASGWNSMVELLDDLNASVEIVEQEYSFTITLPATGGV